MASLAREENQAQSQSFSAPKWCGPALVFVVVAGCLDLIFTVAFMQGPGMIEENPLARELVSYGLPLLVGFKLLTIVGHALPLWLLRGHRSARVAILLSAALMAWLMTHWIQCIHVWSQIPPTIWVDLASDPNWIRL